MIEKLELCNFITKMSRTYSYYGSTSYYFKPNPIEQLKDMEAKLEENFLKAKDAHGRNIPLIEINKNLSEKIRTFMKDEIGLAEKYSVWELPTPRSKHKKLVTKTAGYMDDMIREIKVSDNFAYEELTYTNLKKYIEEERKKLNAAEEDFKKVKEQNVVKNKQNIAVMQIIVKYGMNDSGIYDPEDVNDILEFLLAKDKYLALAHGGLASRMNWSDGFYKAESALGNFKVETEIDQEIVDDWNEIFTSDETDGRAFRDTEYNYSYLFGLVEDKQLLEDYEFISSLLTDW